MQGFSIFKFLGAATRAADFLGRKDVSSIKGDQQLILEYPKMLQIARLIQTLPDLRHHWIDLLGRHGREQVTDLVVAGNLVDAKNRLRVALAPALLDTLLSIQKGWTLGEKYRKRAQCSIADAVALVVSPLRGSGNSSKVARSLSVMTLMLRFTGGGILLLLLPRCSPLLSMCDFSGGNSN